MNKSQQKKTIIEKRRVSSGRWIERGADEDEKKKGQERKKGGRSVLKD